MYQPSVNAKVSTLGHVPGNIRIICRFLNCVDRSRRDQFKSQRSNGDAPQQWTPAKLCFV
mgnify:FL=1